MKTVIICCMVLLCPAVMAQKKAKNNINAEQSSCLTTIEAGTVFYVVREEAVSDKGWNAHPIYKGVYLKHLVLGSDTDNRLSCHIVKVDPYCTLEEHLHDGKLELHEVIAGSGTCFLNGKEITYLPGVIGVIPANVKHKVTAGKNGLYLMAKFAPALQ